MTISEEEFENFAYLEALKNALSFNGKANPKALIGKCVPKFPEMKKDMAHYMNLINNICSQVNELDVNLQAEKIKELEPDFLEKSKEKKTPPKKDGLPELNNTENGIVVRIEPAPSGHMHLGHLFPIIANYELKKKYGGKMILRMADTNPDNIDIKNYDKVIEDIKWICDNDIDEIMYQSDRMDLYYKYLRTLIETNNAYVCFCDSESFKAYTDSKEPCPHRDIPHDKQLEFFENFMSHKIQAGEAVIRFKADYTHKNPAMRSFSLARINENSHARVGKKYSVWPTMHLAVAIDDTLSNITHVVRGKDHEINMERQKLIHKALGLKSPEYFHIGRMKFEDLELSKTKLSTMIEEKKFDGWADPRVPSILAYKTRGYKAEAFRKFILSLGISKRDSKITSEEYHKGLDYFNKQILEKTSSRYFFVHRPKIVQILNPEDYPSKTIEIAKHPDDPSRGFRHFKLEKEYFIDGIDFDNLNEGNKFRMMHFGNFRILEKDEDKLLVEFMTKDYDKKLEIKSNIHYVPKSAKKAIVIMQNNSKLMGLVEDINNIKKNDTFQFERFGFVKFNNITSESQIFYFAHR